MGGANFNKTYKSCEIYNVEKNQWKSISDLNDERRLLSASIVNNKFIYLFGGHYN